jgi:F-type H+-transporting ATPase subunit delta
MARRGSAKRHAQALFDIGLERGQLDAWAGDLHSIREALQTEELRAFLEHAKVPLSRKVRIIEGALPGADPLLRNLLSLLVSRGLVDLMGELETEYGRLLDQHRGREHVEVYSVVPLEDTERERISRFLTGLIEKEVLLDSRVDPSILGGLVIRVGDKLIDGSTRTRLEELGKQLQRYGAGVGA